MSVLPKSVTDCTVAVESSPSSPLCTGTAASMPCVALILHAPRSQQLTRVVATSEMDLTQEGDWRRFESFWRTC